MEVRYYHSDVAPAQTAGEIQEMLAKAGADRVALAYDDGHPTGVEFVLTLDGRPMGFRLEPDIDAMKRALEKDGRATGKRQSIEQAHRTAWRLQKAWIEVQLAYKACDQASLDQLLLGFGVTQTGETVYHRLVHDKKLLQSHE